MSDLLINKKIPSSIIIGENGEKKQVMQVYLDKTLVWEPQDYLTFTANKCFIIHFYKLDSSGSFPNISCCATNKGTWVEVEEGRQVVTSVPYIYMRGESNSILNIRLAFEAVDGDDDSLEINCSGDIETLRGKRYNRQTPGESSEYPVMGEGCYQKLFQYNWCLKSAPTLSPTTLSSYCYFYMFNRCGLLVSPELPARDLSSGEGQYKGMFRQCSSMYFAGKMNANKFGKYSCQLMFQDCRKLLFPPETNFDSEGVLGEGAFQEAFNVDTSLVSSMENILQMPLFFPFTQKYQDHSLYETFAQTAIRLFITPTGEGCDTAWRLPIGYDGEVALGDEVLEQTFRPIEDKDCPIKEGDLLYCYWSPGENYVYGYDGEQPSTPISLPRNPIDETYDYNFHYWICLTGGNVPADGPIIDDQEQVSMQNGDAIFAENGKWRRVVGKPFQYRKEDQTGEVTYNTYYLRPTDYLTFFSKESSVLCLTITSPNWTGTGKLEYSLDGEDWQEINQETSYQQKIVTTEAPYIFLRGEGITSFTQEYDFSSYPTIYEGYSDDDFTGTYCESAQKLLNYFGITDFSGNSLDIDGVMGEKTQQAVYNFQNEYYLPSTGKFDSFCWEKVTELKSAPTNFNFTDKEGYSTVVECSGYIEVLRGKRYRSASQNYQEMDNKCYQHLFEGDESLINTPFLNAKQLSNGCYQYMFANCTNLSSVSAIPQSADSTIFTEGLKDSCCAYMFSGCTSLNQNSKVEEFIASLYNLHKNLTPSSAEVTSVCKGMFYNCVNLNFPTVEEGFYLPRVVGEAWYESMFEGCKKLTTIPIDLLTNVSSTNSSSSVGVCIAYGEKTFDSCYKSMFKSCEALTYAPILPRYITDTLTEVTIPEIYPLGEGMLESMFEGCKALNSFDLRFVLPSGLKRSNCFKSMFKGCSAITTVEFVIPDDSQRTYLAESCYESMFEECVDLESVPSNFISEAWYGKNSCAKMFLNCTSYNGAILCYPISQFTVGSFYQMYKNCIALQNGVGYKNDSYSGDKFNSCRPAPEFNFNYTEEDLGTFEEMFSGCVALTEAISLKAIKYADKVPSCFKSMYEGCSSITLCPELNTGENWYVPFDASRSYRMYYQTFKDCTSLIALPILQVKGISAGLGKEQFVEMFSGCESIVISSTKEYPFTEAYSIPMSGYCAKGQQSIKALQDILYSEWDRELQTLAPHSDAGMGVYYIPADSYWEYPIKVSNDLKIKQAYQTTKSNTKITVE